MLPVRLLPHSVLLVLTPFPPPLYLCRTRLLDALTLLSPDSSLAPGSMKSQDRHTLRGWTGYHFSSAVIVIPCLFYIKSKYVPKLWTWLSWMCFQNNTLTNIGVAATWNQHRVSPDHLIDHSWQQLRWTAAVGKQRSALLLSLLIHLLADQWASY